MVSITNFSLFLVTFASYTLVRCFNDTLTNYLFKNLGMVREEEDEPLSLSHCNVTII